jgi:hypothetical protein
MEEGDGLVPESLGEEPGRLGGFNLAALVLSEQQIVIPETGSADDPRPDGVEHGSDLAVEGFGEFLLEPFGMNRAGEADMELKLALPALLAGIKGHEKLAIADP